jgi:hypothetical protein
MLTCRWQAVNSRVETQWYVYMHTHVFAHVDASVVRSTTQEKLPTVSKRENRCLCFMTVWTKRSHTKPAQWYPNPGQDVCIGHNGLTWPGLNYTLYVQYQQEGCKFIKDSPEVCTCAYIYWGGGFEFTWMLLVARKGVTLKVQFSDEVAGLTKLDKTQRLVGLLHSVLTPWGRGI